MKFSFHGKREEHEWVQKSYKKHNERQRRKWRIEEGGSWPWAEQREWKKKCSCDVMTGVNVERWRTGVTPGASQALAALKFVALLPVSGRGNTDVHHVVARRLVMCRSVRYLLLWHDAVDFCNDNNAMIGWSLLTSHGMDWFKIWNLRIQEKLFAICAGKAVKSLDKTRKHLLQAALRSRRRKQRGNTGMDCDATCCQKHLHGCCSSDFVFILLLTGFAKSLVKHCSQIVASHRAVMHSWCCPSSCCDLAKLAVTNHSGQLECDRRLNPKSPFKFSLSFQTFCICSLPDGNMREIQRIKEMFHLLCQLGSLFLVLWFPRTIGIVLGLAHLTC